MEPINKIKKGTILIADDREEFRKIYGDRLSFAGYNILEAQNGEEALKILEDKHPDLIISDINMPRMDGYQLIANIKAKDEIKNIPILVMSVFDQSEHLKKAVDLGAIDYLVKGTNTPNAVVEKVDALFAQMKSNS